MWMFGAPACDRPRDFGLTEWFIFGQGGFRLSDTLH